MQEGLISDEQKLKFYSDGFIILKNVIPKELLDSALRKINYWLWVFFHSKKLFLI